MKKSILIFLSVFFVAFLAVMAQKKVSIQKSDLSVLNVNVEQIDSVGFTNEGTLLNVYNNGVGTGVDVSSVDSIIFLENELNLLPVLETTVAGTPAYTSVAGSFQIKSAGGTTVTEAGICYAETTQPTIENAKTLTAVLSKNSSVSLTGLKAGTQYYARSFATNAAGTAYGPEITFTTQSYSMPVVQTISATYDYANNRATCLSRVVSNGGCTLTERGICWSTSRNPTINDSKFASGTSVGQYYALMNGLSLNSTYYVRAFATNCLGTSYGEELKVQPLMGNITYTLAQSVIDAGESVHNLIKTAMDSACFYYNRYTTFRGNIWVYYNAGIPTAQASYHGSIGFGPNTTYMWVGTAMHEIAHFVGSGTHGNWRSLLSNGVWTGTVASTLLKNLTGDVLRGDNNSNPIHFWPYGINYRSEITNLGSQANQEKALEIHCRLVQAMVVDDAKIPNTW